MFWHISSSNSSAANTCDVSEFIYEQKKNTHKTKIKSARDVFELI